MPPHYPPALPQSGIYHKPIPLHSDNYEQLSKSLTHDLGLVSELTAFLLEVRGLELALGDLSLDVLGEAVELVGDDALGLLLVEVDEGADLAEASLHPLPLHRHVPLQLSLPTLQLQYEVHELRLPRRHLLAQVSHLSQLRFSNYTG